MTQPLFTPELDKRLRLLREQGVTNAKIGSLLGCSRHTVDERVAALQLPKRSKGRAKSMTSTEKL